jgi:hypothetical protein
METQLKSYTSLAPDGYEGQIYGPAVLTMLSGIRQAQKRFGHYGGNILLPAGNEPESLSHSGRSVVAVQTELSWPPYK